MSKTRRKRGEEHLRKLTKVSSGTSYSLTLPIAVIRRWGWRERQKLHLEIDEKSQTITIKDWKKDSSR